MPKVVPFPQSRNIGKARHVAERWLAKSTKRARQTYWRMIADRYATVMIRVGLSEEEVDRQITDFCLLVEEQIALIDAAPGRRVSLAESQKLYGEAHRVLDEGMADIVSSPEFHHDGPGAA